MSTLSSRNNSRLRQRIEDEQVRQALARGCDRETVADVLDITRRTTFYKEKRAHAFDFPLSTIDSRGGRPAGSGDDGSSEEPAQATMTGGDDGETDDTRWEAVGEQVRESRADSQTDPEASGETPDEQWAAASSADREGDQVADSDATESMTPVGRRLQEAINAFEAVQSAL